MARFRIAVIPGDGIGNETVPEGIKALEAASRKCGFELAFDHYDWSCETFAKTGRMMPEDGLDQLRDTMRSFSVRSVSRGFRIMCLSGGC